MSQSTIKMEKGYYAKIINDGTNTTRSRNPQ